MTSAIRLPLWAAVLACALLGWALPPLATAELPCLAASGDEDPQRYHCGSESRKREPASLMHVSYLPLVA